MGRAQRFLLTAMVAVLVVTAPASAQSDGLTVTATDAAAGETATVTVEFANTGDDPMAAVVSVTSLPDGWSVQSHDDDGGAWRDDRSWLFQTVPAGESVSPSVTVAVPENASGSYSIDASATVGEQTITGQTTVTVTESSGTAGTPTESSGTAGTPTESSGGSGPGFGVGITLGAVLALAIVIGRSQ